MELTPVHSALVRGAVVAPITMDVSPGVLAAGTVADVAAYGGTLVDVEEETGAPGFDVEFTFTGISGARGFLYSVYYVGSSSHVVELQVYNYTTTNWDIVKRIANRTSMEVGSLRVSPIGHVSSGEAKLRFYHISNGVGTHNLYIDYIGLEET